MSMAGWESAHVMRLLSEERMSNMTLIRNRAIHLEPMFLRNVARDVAEARALMGWIDSQALA